MGGLFSNQWSSGRERWLISDGQSVLFEEFQHQKARLPVFQTFLASATVARAKKG